MKTILFPAPANKVPFVMIRPEVDQGMPLPLVIFLHGNGGKGDGSESTSGLYKLSVNKEIPLPLKMAVDRYNFILLAPQLAVGANWDNSETDAMLAYAHEHLNVDYNRVYITGLSLGGGGVRKYITASGNNAEKFAAAIVIAGVAWGTQWQHVADAKLPIWFFHAADDTSVNVSATTSAVKAFRDLNPEVPPLMTIYKAGGHVIWNIVYADSAPASTTNATGDILGESALHWMFSKTNEMPEPDFSLEGSPGVIDLSKVLGRNFTAKAGKDLVLSAVNVPAVDWSGPHPMRWDMTAPLKIKRTSTDNGFAISNQQVRTITNLQPGQHDLVLRAWNSKNVVTVFRTNLTVVD